MCLTARRCVLSYCGEQSCARFFDIFIIIFIIFYEVIKSASCQKIGAKAPTLTPAVGSSVSQGDKLQTRT